MQFEKPKGYKNVTSTEFVKKDKEDETIIDNLIKYFQNFYVNCFSYNL